LKVDQYVAEDWRSSTWTSTASNCSPGPAKTAKYNAEKSRDEQRTGRTANTINTIKYNKKIRQKSKVTSQYNWWYLPKITKRQNERSGMT
jgi:hypothetical protein